AFRLRALARSAAAEAEVDASLHEVDVLTDVFAAEQARAEGNVASAEAIVVVLDEGAPVRREGVFAADAHRPATARVAGGVDRRTRGECGVVAVHPGAAALHVAEEAIPRVADAAGDGRERADMRAGRIDAEARQRAGRIDGIRCARVGPVIVALDAD